MCIRDRSYPISHKMSTLKPSVIREILKYSSDPNVISFAAGNPASETFPVEKIAAITADILQKDPTAALQYSLSDGYPALCTTLERWLAQDYGIDFSENTLLITSGAQQGIDLVTKCLCDEGDTVLVEKPTFIGALNTFRSYGAVSYTHLPGPAKAGTGGVGAGGPPGGDPPCAGGTGRTYSIRSPS